MQFKVTKQKIPEVLLIEPSIFEDKRGFFLETYRKSEFPIKVEFKQDNHSKSNKNVLRGLHFQKLPKKQGKLIRCTKGSIFDVAVDIRKESPTYKKHVAAILSEENKYILWIPPGFAHGYLTLKDNTEVQYKCTEEYSKEHDVSILWNDKELNIDWPIKNPILSEKDKNAPTLKEVIEK
ncbi:MAG: dTDP-4-dehydrorhamnose 3,5-epimerase [Candidatus Woesearchaeota archaeon]